MNEVNELKILFPTKRKNSFRDTKDYLLKDTKKSVDTYLETKTFPVSLLHYPLKPYLLKPIGNLSINLEFQPY